MARKLLGKISRMIEMNDGERIGSGFNVRPAPYLPIVEFDTENDIGIVMKKGTIVTFDSNGYLIPCTGGDTTVSLTYTALDVQYEVYDLDTGAALTTTSTSSAKLAANYPVGVLQYDVHQYQPDNHYYYHIQDHVAILEDKLVLFALDATRASEYTWTPGVSVIPDADGHPVPISASSFVPDSSPTDLKSVQTLTITAACTASGTITIDGVGIAVTVGTAVTTASVAALIRAGTFPGWVVAGSDTTAVFTSTTYGAKDALTLSPAATGVAGAFVQTTTGVYGSADSVLFLTNLINFKVGKVIRVIDLLTDVDKNFLGGYEAVIVPTGYNLPGQETGGIGAGIDATSKKGVLIQLQF